MSKLTFADAVHEVFFAFSKYVIDEEVYDHIVAGINLLCEYGQFVERATDVYMIEENPERFRVHYDILGEASCSLTITVQTEVHTEIEYEAE